MSDAKSPSDLSMDEILTAIRRIIADDEQSSAASPGSGAATGAVLIHRMRYGGYRTRQWSIKPARPLSFLPFDGV